MEPAENQSEVANLLRQIEDEYTAATQGLEGLAEGTARHKFITRKMENMGRLHEDLRELVGEDSMKLVAARLEKMPGNQGGR